MAETSRELRDPTAVVPTGLRLRIWIGCLGAALLGAAGILGVAGTFLPVTADMSPGLISTLPWVAAAVPLLAGVLLALWLERGIVGPLRDISRALLLQDGPARRSLGDASAWGELGSLASAVRTLLIRLELCARESDDLRAARDRLEAGRLELRGALDRWAAGEPAPVAERDPLEALRPTLERREALEIQEYQRVRQQMLDVGAELVRDLEIAREAVEHAERGFVEATGMLSSLREIERLVGELESALAAEAGVDRLSAQRESIDGFREAATVAIEELAAASVASVERLATGLGRVQEIAAQSQVLANRATLIALEAATHREADPAAGESLMGLARDAQAATARTDELARDVDREVSAASEHMRGVRERTAETLSRAPHTPGPAPSSAPPAMHLLDRLRETIADAAGKGERLAASGERASSAAERLVRKLDADGRTFEALASDAGIDERGETE